jgi:hypothetical protein
LAERWQRAAWAQQKWAERAKQAVDFFEGRQWTETQLSAMARGKRPALQFNIIAPIVRMVLGYQRSNKTDITYKPGQDTRASEHVAEALTGLDKIIASAGHMEFVDTEVFLDGLIADRGFYDTRLDWETNDLGELLTKAVDPFTIYPDPDADTYDLNESAAFMQTSKFVSLDEVEAALGRDVADLIRPFTMGQTPLAPISSLIVNDEITPVRFFGEREDLVTDWWDSFYSLMGDFVDRHRKTIRIIESQYKVREPRNVIIDLETGDKKVLPVDWGPDKIEKALLYAAIVENPCIVQRRMVERIHWTTMAGDLILYDAPSMFDRYTQTGYFPYFRRGFSRGMVEDLIDPQKEKNKRRSAEVEIVSKTANGGWEYHEDSLDPVQERRLIQHGSTPGFNLKWKGAGGDKKPHPIQATKPDLRHERLEIRADEDVRKISGINEEALGATDPKVMSGRAIEARQRQAVISVQLYMDNFKRTKSLVGASHLAIFQTHYTEMRIYRITGESGKDKQLIINQLMVDPITGAKRIQNDVTIAKYVVKIDDSPLSATFQNAQFEEMLVLLEKFGPAIGPMLPMFADLIIGMSSMPRKDEWIARLQQIMGMQAQQPQPGPGGPQRALPPPQGGGQGLDAQPAPPPIAGAA